MKRKRRRFTFEGEEIDRFEKVNDEIVIPTCSDRFRRALFHRVSFIRNAGVDETGGGDQI